MVKVALIGCTKRKRKSKCKAVEMYSPSATFRNKLDYCKKINIDKIYILSAKYGLLELDDIIETYDCYLNKTSKEYRKNWNEKVLCDLKDKTDIENDEFILLAGKTYREGLEKSLPHTENPVPGLNRGEQMHYFKEFKNDYMIDAFKLRNQEELTKINDKPGYYKWWAKKEELDIILEKLNTPFDEIKNYLEQKNNLYCIYIGIAVKESVRARINWHVNDSHTKSRVENKTLSTLRQSISSIVAENQYNKIKTNEFIDKLKIEYFTSDNPINSKEAKKELEEKEKDLMINNLYVLNIKDNNHPKAEPIKKQLRKLRKLSRKPEKWEKITE